MRLIGWCALGAAVALAGPAAAQSAAALPFDPDVATRQWLDTMGPEATARSNAYFEGGYWIQFVGPLLTIIISMAMMAVGWAKGVRNWLEKTVKIYFFVVVGMALFYQVVSTILTFPLQYYVGFVREHQFGLATQEFGPWLIEQLQGAGIGLLIGSFAIAALYLIIRALKRTWWLWGTVATLVFISVLAMLAPVYLAPIFNHYYSMEDGPLKTSILHLAQASGVPADDVQEFDVSRQSNRVTANVSGFGSTTHVSLSDTLIQRSTPGAVRAVMGHEIGHYVLNHTVSLLIMNAMVIAATFALANLLFNWLSRGQRWGVRDIADPAGLPLLFAILAFLGAVSTPIGNNITRFHESQADIFGINASREPDGWSESALLLSEYRKMEPSPLELWLFYDHPSGYQRIHMAMEWKAHEMAAGRYPMGPGGPPAGWRPDFVVMHQTPASAPAAAPEISAPTPVTTPAPSPAAPSN